MVAVELKWMIRDWVWTQIWKLRIRYEGLTEKEGNKDDVQVSGISNWATGAIYQDERKAEGVTRFGELKVKVLIWDMFEMPMK